MLKDRYEQSFAKTVVKQQHTKAKLDNRAKALNEAVEDLQMKHRQKQEKIMR